jgi:uncharacterized membrane protein YvbJ
MQKKTRFFCDNCGTEVPAGAKDCPKCGRHFASVLCPACGHVGEDDDFMDGCPSCGYSSKPKSTQAPLSKEREDKHASGPLPIWVYIVTALAFAAIVLALFFRGHH